MTQDDFTDALVAISAAAERDCGTTLAAVDALREVEEAEQRAEERIDQIESELEAGTPEPPIRPETPELPEIPEIDGAEQRTGG